jgi:hypothetical protein
MSQAEELCTNCGAPRAAGYAACKYCKTPFVQDTQTQAIPCPRCNTLNELGSQKCVQCQAWVVVQCVFCHALSPHNVPSCAKCGEAFAGAPQRFAERQRAQQLHTGLEIAGTVGNVAASFLGAAAGAGVFSHHERPGYGGYEQRGYDPSFDASQAAASQSGDGGGFFSSLFGSGSSDDSGTGNLAQTSSDSGDGNGGGILSSLFGGDSSSGDGGDSSSGDGGDSGGFFGDNS